MRYFFLSLIFSSYSAFGLDIVDCSNRNTSLLDELRKSLSSSSEEALKPACNSEMLNRNIYIPADDLYFKRDKMLADTEYRRLEFETQASEPLKLIDGTRFQVIQNTDQNATKNDTQTIDGYSVIDGTK